MNNEAYRTIPLTNGLIAKVSLCDYGRLAKYRWSAITSKGHWTPYAIRPVKVGLQWSHQFMHREILNLTRGDKRVSDHINGNGLDNRRSNLRACTQSQNCCNSRTKSHSRTQLKGAFIKDGRDCFYSKIVVGRRVIYLGQFLTAEQAHAAYCDAAKKYHGDFARLK